MAIVTGPILFTGRIGNTVYYKVGHEIYCRSVFSGMRKRAMKDRRYLLFRVYSGLMARSSKIGSTVYRALPKDFRQYWMYRAFVGEAMTLFKRTGMQDEEILALLWKTYVEVWELKRGRQQVAEKAGLAEEVRQPEKKPIVKIRWKINEGGLVDDDLPVFLVVRKVVPAARAPDCTHFMLTPGKIYRGNQPGSWLHLTGIDSEND